MLLVACSTKKGSDAGVDEDTGAPCGPPKEVVTADVGAGLLAPVAVEYLYAVDGDTVHLRWQGQDRSFRLVYVNTEEASGTEATAFGKLTANFLKDWLDASKARGMPFLAAPQDKGGQPNVDPYGRILSLLFVGGVLVQQRLVREGWSAYYTVFGCAPEPIGTALLLSEKEAREAQLGIWKPGHPKDYAQVLSTWTVGQGACRPNPFAGQPYCP